MVHNNPSNVVYTAWGREKTSRGGEMGNLYELMGMLWLTNKGTSSAKTNTMISTWRNKSLQHNNVMHYNLIKWLK